MGIFGNGALSFGHWFGSRRQSSQSRQNDQARRFRFKFLKRFRSSGGSNQTPPTCPISKNFVDALAEEDLLVPGSSDHPALNICVGIRDDELQHYRRLRYRSYGRSRWDDVFATPGVRKVALEMDANEPIIDELPASLWLNCVDPILPALISLSAMQRRRTNLTKSRPSATPVQDPNEVSTDHGDLDRGPPWLNVIGPQNVHIIFLVNLPATAEVRPTDLLGNEFYMEKMRMFDIVTARRGRKNVRSKFTNITRSRGVNSLMNTDQSNNEEEEDGSYQSESDSGNEGN
ncbi:uncharacterized protein LOC133203908 [Saccostrea echinata]|uniref:uncharacterized protein LOC133203908 n=1 Tax=Saccostrea echinata TaxID=191078 RepID=UPI002A7FAB86|nr:uncharacterized protein LOC133203908 [Saccostrea echinata]